MLMTESTLLFQRLIESVPDAVIVVDTGGTIRLVNRQTEQLFGYGRAELLGRPIEILVPERVALFHQGLRDSYFADPQTRPTSAGLELTARRKDGSEFPVDISLSPLETDEGRLVSAWVRDVTERAAAESARASLAAIVGSSRDAIIGTTITGMITGWNPGAEHIYGYSSDEAVGRDVRDMFSSREASEEDRIFARAAKGERIEAYYETARTRKDGVSIDVSISVSPIRDGRGTVVGLASIHRDITDRKRADEKLQGLLEGAPRWGCGRGRGRRHPRSQPSDRDDVRIRARRDARSQGRDAAPRALPRSPFGDAGKLLRRPIHPADGDGP